METAIGVFSSRERAEQAVQELLDQKVPREAIVFLTRSETEATSVGKELAVTVGGLMGFATGMSTGVSIAMLLLVPEIGQVFALGFGAAALLGLAGAGAGSAIGKSVGRASTDAQPTPEEEISEEVTFFREVLAEGRSLVVVRTESHQTATVANGILNRLGIVIKERSGLGELVKTYTTIRNQGGQLKLVRISKRVHDLLQRTKLHAVFDIQPDEATAIQSFQATAALPPETAR